MGFKLIRDKSQEERRKIELLYTAELEKEIRRWTNITNSYEKEKELLDRFSLVKSSRKALQSPEESVDLLTQNIRNNQKSLIQAQGNMDVEKLLDLLS
jgi:hypothetical protein